MKLRFSPVNYIFGAPGVGKSTVLAMIAQDFLKKKVRVYSNTPIVGTILINDDDLGRYSFRSSVILLDEAGLSYNNRDFKKGLMSDPDRLQYWKLVRHYNSIIILATQGWDECDKKCRILAQSFFCITRSIIPGFTTIKPVLKKVDIDENTHQPCDYFMFDTRFHWKHCWRRRYYKYFDSYSAPDLPEYDDENNLVVPSDVHPEYIDFSMDVPEEDPDPDPDDDKI